MQITINDKNEITGYATVGSLEHGIEITAVPADFQVNFKTGFYLYANNLISVNQDWMDPSTIEPIIEPTVTEQQLASLIKSNAQQVALNAQLIKQSASQTQLNATLVKQISQIQGGTVNV